ncbi:unnamed protein product, partial [Prorocentrum cordatum]
GASNRGRFYVVADKIGTLRTDHNYKPWVHYRFAGKWSDDLWTDRKLDHATYLCSALAVRVGFANRKRDLDMALAREADSRIDETMAEVGRTLDQLKALFRAFPEATAWEGAFLLLGFRWKQLALDASGASGKSSFAESLFANPYALAVEDAEHLDLRGFGRDLRDGIVLDNVNSWQQVLPCRAPLQARSAKTRGGQSAANIYAYTQYLFGVAIAVTVDLDAPDAHLADCSHEKRPKWLRKNCVFARPPAGEAFYDKDRVVVRSLTWSKAAARGSVLAPPARARPPDMPTGAESARPRSMDFRNQRKAVMLRTVNKLTWDQIKDAAVARDGGSPSASQRKRVVEQFSTRLGEFARFVSSKTPAHLDRYFAMAMDGVALSLPPNDAVDRANYCRAGEPHMRRMATGAAKPELSGRNDYAQQIPYSRQFRKANAGEWVRAVSAGKLAGACRAARAGGGEGPWRVLRDDESFLMTAESKAATRKARVSLWRIPSRSPDLNPVEKYWSHLRRRLRKHDLADLVAGRPPVMRAALKERVRRLLGSAGAKTAARNTARSLGKTCQEVLKKKGAATRGGA